MRILLALILLAPLAALANPNDAACVRLKDVYENTINRSMTNAQADVAMEAEAREVSVAGSNATKCTAILAERKRRLQTIVNAYNKSLQADPGSPEVD